MGGNILTQAARMYRAQLDTRVRHLESEALVMRQKHHSMGGPMPLPDALTAAEQRASARDAERIIVLEQQLAEAQGQLGAEHAAHLATGRWLADTEQQLMDARAVLYTIAQMEDAETMRGLAASAWAKGEPGL